MLRATHPQPKSIQAGLTVRDVILEALLNWFRARDNFDKEDFVLTLFYYNDPFSDGEPNEYGALPDQMIEGACFAQSDHEWGQAEVAQYASLIRANIVSRIGMTVLCNPQSGTETTALLIIVEAAEEMYVTFQPYTMGQPIYEDLSGLRSQIMEPGERYDWIDWVLPANKPKGSSTDHGGLS